MEVGFYSIDDQPPLFTLMWRQEANNQCDVFNWQNQSCRLGWKTERGRSTLLLIVDNQFLQFDPTRRTTTLQQPELVMEMRQPMCAFHSMRNDTRLVFFDPNGQVRQIDWEAKTVSTVAGQFRHGVPPTMIRDGPVDRAIFGDVCSISSDTFGNLLAYDRSAKGLRRIDHRTGIVQTIAVDVDDMPKQSILTNETVVIKLDSPTRIGQRIWLVAVGDLGLRIYVLQALSLASSDDCREWANEHLTSFLPIGGVANLVAGYLFV